MSDAEIIELLSTLIHNIQENNIEEETKRELHETIVELTSNSEEDAEIGAMTAAYLIRGWYLTEYLDDSQAITTTDYCPLCLRLKNNDE